MENIRFPTLAEIVALHTILIDEFGGAQGTKDIGLVDSALMGAQQTFGGQFLYSTLSDMAAAIWHGLACNHGFADGNKRVALAGVDLFLQYNGLQLALSEADAEAVTLRIASSELNRDELCRLIPSWIESRKVS